MIRRPPRSTLSSSSAASDVYKRQVQQRKKAMAAAKKNKLRGKSPVVARGRGRGLGRGRGGRGAANTGRAIEPSDIKISFSVGKNTTASRPAPPRPKAGVKARQSVAKQQRSVGVAGRRGQAKAAQQAQRRGVSAPSSGSGLSARFGSLKSSRGRGRGRGRGPATARGGGRSAKAAKGRGAGGAPKKRGGLVMPF
eukprot:TRINITY_DN50266_c0_g1_i2.p1 TRINITY_DN50266_c0_g1~~TRINITY_DN50266_c0_g1_i2.p1  ORF type:complete len:195 (-),score=31.90 TRINITY_DN50266_c0_g1_i2:435-1019(-)